MPHIGWLKSSMAQLSSPGSSGVALTCNKVTCISSLVLITFFHSTLYEFNAHLYQIPNSEKSNSAY